jgi:hypothetical protein
MRYSIAISLGLLSSGAGLAQEQAQEQVQDQVRAQSQEPEEHTIKSNLEYRLSRGDLPQLSFGVEKAKNVEVIGGAEDLLKSCLSDSTTWSKDPLMFRLAHTHAASIQSCRENSSPSMHVIFRQLPDQPLRAWIHLDGHGAQTSESRMVHFGEFIYHKITLQTNDQDRMFENLQRSFDNSLQTPPDQDAPLTGRERFTFFTAKTVTKVQPYAASVVSSAFAQMFYPSDVWGRGTDGFTNHLVGSFTQRLVTYGLQSGAAAALHEDLRYKPSLSSNILKRSGHALFSTLVIETPRGNDFAYANIVAAVGSGVVINTYRPGQENFTHSGAWKLAGFNLLGFAQGNLWNEFKPDLKHLVRSKILHRN